MSEKEMDARRMVEQLKKLPESVQERVGYIIEGAALVHGLAAEAAKAGSNARQGA